MPIQNKLSPDQLGKRSRNITGERYGRLTVLPSFSWKGLNEKYEVWDCICDCGNKTSVRKSQLFTGHTQSCGCLFIERAQERRTSHGMRKHPLYSTWNGMMQRCYNFKCQGFYAYGGCGIGVDPEWHDFKTFVEDVGDRPENHTLHRPDSRNNYGRANAVWADKKTQMTGLRLPQETEVDFWNHHNSGVLSAADKKKHLAARQTYLKHVEKLSKRKRKESLERKTEKQQTRTTPARFRGEESKKKERQRSRWNHMMDRCYNPEHKQYHRYGGRGILVETSWHSFHNFLNDTGYPPPGHSLDRPDNNGSYGPSNWRWATYREQNRNKESKTQPS